MSKYLSKSFIISIVVIIITAHFFYPRWQKNESEASFSWDVFGYYLYLPAAFIYNDLDKLQFIDAINTKYQPAGANFKTIPLENGNTTGQYSLGWSIFHFPAFVAGHLLSKLSDYPSDGFSKPYQIALSFYGLLIAILGLILSFLNLRNYFEAKVAYISVFLILIGTNALNYFSIDTAHTHNPLFFLYALLIYLTIAWYKKSTFFNSIFIGLCLGLMCTMRPTEVIAISIPLFWGVYNKDSLIQRLNKLTTNKKHLVLSLCSFLIFPIIQLLYWKIITGSFLFYSYGEQSFSWFHPHIQSVLFSFRKGWFIYTPLATLFVLGMPFLYKKEKSIFAVVLLFSFVNFYIVASWDIWWYGGSLGQRALIQSYAVMIFALSALVSFCLQRKWSTYLLFMFSFFAIAQNLLLTYKAHSNSPFEAEAMTKAFFLRTYLEFEPKAEWYKLLDTDFIYEDSPNNKKIIKFKGDNKILTLNEKRRFSDSLEFKIEDNPPYFRLNFIASSPKINSYFWDMPQINLTQKNAQGEIINNKFIRLHRFMKANTSTHLFFDISLNKSTKQVDCYLSSPNQVSNLTVEIKNTYVFYGK